MQEVKNTIKSIAQFSIKKKATPKRLREVEFQELADWLIWAEIAMERSNKELDTAEFEADLLGIMQNQFTELPETHIAMARLMVKYSVLMANEKYLSHVLAKIYEKVNQIKKIEKVTNKGGRKPNKELYEIADLIIQVEFSKTGKKPSGGKLSKLVEQQMIAKFGSIRKDGNLYLSDRSARNFIKQWQAPVKFNRQELVSSFSNK